MATPKWQPGHLYQPGDLVVPKTTHAVTATPILHPDFDGTGTDWSVVGDVTHAGWLFASVGAPPVGFTGNFAVEYGATGGSSRLDNAVRAPVSPGQTITAHIQINTNGHSSSDGATISMLWYDSGGTFLQEDFGPYTGGDGSSNWRQISVTAVAPASAAFASIGLRATRTGAGFIWFNHATWDYTYAAPPDALTFVAVQALPGNSASTEPTWPTILGNTVVDNQVTWQAIAISRVSWLAAPITKSASPEPTWPTTVGGSIVDGTVKWVATSRRITDTRCPASKVVMIAVSKIFAGDNDIVAFSATVNPIDWSSADDAGYLPTGLQTFGANPNAVLGLYRGNLVALNSGGFQMWQVDQDPANMALLDAQPVGSTYPKAVQAVANDLAFLTAQGVRNIGIAAASANLQLGGFGEPVDSLVKAYIAGGQTPRSLYYPSRGQYWLFFGTDIVVLTMNGTDKKSYSWSRYVLPEVMTDWTLSGDTIYIRTASNKVLAIDETALADDSIPVTVLLHCDGTNGSTVFTDSAPTPHSFARAFSSATINTAVKEFGTGALKLVGGDFLRTAIAADLQIDSVTKDFTLEAWINITTVGGGTANPLFIAANGSGYRCFNFIIDTTGHLSATGTTAAGGVAYSVVDPAVFPAGVWTHVALERVGSQYTLYKNGVAVATAAGGIPATGTAFFDIGGDLGSSVYTVGYMDEIRFSNGVAVFAGPFTPPTAAYTSLYVGVPFHGILQWPFVDMGQLGTEKQMEGFDLVGTGIVDVSFGYDQRNFSLYTAPFTMDADGLPGAGIIGMPLTAPSFSLKLDFAPNQAWKWNAANLYITDDTGSS